MQTSQTWDGTTSYKRGDKVSHKGRLVQCNVASLGFDTQAPRDLHLQVQQLSLFKPCYTSRK